ncbi:TPA: tape measure protein [Streptococcus agalactiae]|nr:tape measure protein [Streptococcus agalactiae]HEN5754410.1 tape measure protein [Streptococcus agalactiae]HEN5759249.1 tape measure protein [Streptococcus agalactiae]HEN5785779.1 tape measure protein [Streptococcus agalactiae]HEN6221569.1 tape measure protein [Streptococcus agalactiae]
MADGSVTIKVDLDGSSAQSGVSKLKTLLGGLESTGSKVGSVFKSVLGANLISSALTTGIGVVTGGIREMAGELNSSQKAWKTFEGNLQAFGRSPEVIKAAKTEMQDFATKTIYSASDMASTYSQLDAVGTKNVGSLVKAFGGLAASAENPAQAMKSLSTQATQMASKPKVAWMDFKIMMEQAPAGMAAVAKEMGMSTAELVSAVQDGKVKTEDFFDAMNRAGNSDAFQKMATEFKTVDQAIDGAKESLANKLMPMFEHLNKFGIKAVNALSDALESIDFGGMADGLGKFLESINLEGIVAKVSGTISSLVGKVKTFWTAFANTGAVSAFIGAIQSIAGAIGHLWESLTASSVLNTLASVLGNVVKWLSQAATVAANFISSLPAGAIQAIVGGLVGLVAGFKAFNFLKSFNPFSLFKKGAEEAVDVATNSVKRSKSTITQLFNGLSNVIKSLGTAIKAAATGIGQGLKAALSGLAPVIRAFGAALKTAGVANILAFGGAIAIAAVGIGAGVAIIAAGFALLATQSQGVSTILQAVGSVIVSVGTAIGTILNLALQGLANALVIVAPVLPTIASAFAQLSPLITAAGSAIATVINSFSSLAPVITALGSALSQVIASISSGIAQIATAVTPIVEIISSAFVQVVTVVSQAIVQIIQALAPFIPAISAMVQAVAPVLQSLVEAFNNLISQISPIIDSLTQLFQTFGEQVSSILESAGSVVESFGSAIRSVLDGVAGIFESMGNAAKNAGQGVKLMAQGVKMLVDLRLGDLVGTLAAVATGLGAVANSGIASAGPGLQQAGNGLRLIAISAQIASLAMQSLPSVFSTLNSSIGTLPSVMTTASSAMTTFASATISSFAGLVGSTASISALQSRITALSISMLMAQVGASTMSAGFSSVSSVLGMLGGVLGAITGQFTAITAAAMIARTSIMQLATSVPLVASGFANISSAATSAMSQLNLAVRSAMAQAVATMTSSMAQMVSVVRSSASQMTQAGQQAGRGVSDGVTNGIRSGIGSATAAMSAMVNAIRSTGMAGASAMRGVGAMIGQGLAQGMYSALGAVTAAANALVAQAERAAQAKAKIHSPSRLFRDNVGRYIAQGIAVGIEKNTSDVTDSLAYVQKEMSAFKFEAEELLGVGNSKFTKVVQIKTEIAQAVKAKVEITKHKSDELMSKALDVAKKATEQPVHIDVSGETIATASKKETYKVQKEMKENIDRIEGLFDE